MMFDDDIAKLYKVETKIVNEAVIIIFISFVKDLVGY